jgi:hypothetical protein
MSFKNTILALAVVGIGAIASAGSALAVTYSYVGSWTPYNNAAPTWYGNGANGPLAYTGQEAAALLFGGTASTYVISTISSNVVDINRKSWYDVIGVGGNIFADNYANKYLGQYYGPNSGFNCCGNAFVNINAASAFIRDNSVLGTNYAFKVSAVPLPAALPLFGTAILGAFGLARRRRQRAI